MAKVFTAIKRVLGLAPATPAIEAVTPEALTTPDAAIADAVSLPSVNPTFTLNGGRVWVNWGNISVEFTRTENIADLPNGLTEMDLVELLIMLAARKAGYNTFEEIRQSPAAFRTALNNIRTAVM